MFLGEGEHFLPTLKTDHLSVKLLICVILTVSLSIYREVVNVPGMRNLSKSKGIETQRSEGEEFTWPSQRALVKSKGCLLSRSDLHCLVPICEEAERGAVKIHEQWLYALPSVKREDPGFFLGSFGVSSVVIGPGLL